MIADVSCYEKNNRIDYQCDEDFSFVIQVINKVYNPPGQQTYDGIRQEEPYFSVVSTVDSDDVYKYMNKVVGINVWLDEMAYGNENE